MSTTANDIGYQVPHQTPLVQTVGEHLDQKIKELRRQLEEACITRAKAEAAQMLNVPMDFVYKLY